MPFMPFWLIPIYKLVMRFGSSTFTSLKSYWMRWTKLGHIETRKLVQIKEEVKLHLFHIMNNINLEIAHFEMTYIYSTDDKVVAADLLKDREQIEEACRASLIELEKITVVKEAYLSQDFVAAATVLIDKVKYRNWDEQVQPDRDTYGALTSLANEVKTLLQHGVLAGEVKV